MNRKSKNKTGNIMRDLGIVVISVIASLWLVRSGSLHELLGFLNAYVWLGSFVAGIFFTSIFTTAPAIAALGSIALHSPLWQVALIGALGAVVGDLIIFHYIEDDLGAHLATLLSHRRASRRLRALLQLPIVRFFSFLIGGLVLASPIPDEVGIAILGAARVNKNLFALCSFAFNFLGIFVIGLIARAV